MKFYNLNNQRTGQHFHMLLDQYVSKKFFLNLLFSLTAFACIFITVDLLEALSDFIDKKAPALVVASYYFYYLPYIIILSMPVGMLLAAMFSVGQLSKYNELTAMLAAGRSLQRILLPIFGLGLLVSGVMLLFAESVMPIANQRKAEIKQQYFERMPKNLPARLSNLYFQESAGDTAGPNSANPAAAPVRRIFISYYDDANKLAQKVSVQQYRGIFITERFDATQMRWQENADGKTGGWEMLQGYHRQFDGERETLTRFDTLAMPQLSFSPQMLTKVQKDPEEMSYGELQQFIREVARNGGNPDRWLVDLYLKISFPLANFIIVLFGAPLAAGRIRSGGAVGVATSLVVCFLYFGAVKTSQSMGQNGTLNPLLAAWLGNMIFLVAGTIILVKARK